MAALPLAPSPAAESVTMGLNRLLPAGLCCLLLVASGCSRSTEEAAAGSGEAAPASGSAAEAAPKVAPPKPAAPAEEAVRELTPEEISALRSVVGLTPPEPLLVSDLLTRADVREITKFEDVLAEQPIDGLAPSPTYNSIRIGSDAMFGASLQLWRPLEARQAGGRYLRLKETYIAATVDAAPVGDEAFFGEFGETVHYAFHHKASRSVAVITCATKLCDTEKVKALADRVASRL